MKQNLLVCFMWVTETIRRWIYYSKDVRYIILSWGTGTKSAIKVCNYDDRQMIPGHLGISAKNNRYQHLFFSVIVFSLFIFYYFFHAPSYLLISISTCLVSEQEFSRRLLDRKNCKGKLISSEDQFSRLLRIGIFR